MPNTMEQLTMLSSGKVAIDWLLLVRVAAIARQTAHEANCT
jgi:hypothetical protein